ncbi:hypothetical protein NX773_22285 [Massilia solisilvae]|uniref:ABC transporter permease n=1 Tax=Massilia solisilvae TaxID=1811225 RepID=A0ABT2BQW6_9BURK|nr:hypothetical protein [Massilia solisilvae]MCS0610897.1 hypothetical protein [Massilia solisilvae]
MNTLKWLLRREFWEHKGSMFWAPLVVAGILLATMGSSMIFGLAKHGVHMTINGHPVHQATVFRALPVDLRSDVINVITSGYLAVSAPLFMMLAIVVFFYCLGALYDERRDRSILFWKSLPTSDEMTVLSKVLTAAIVTPVITMAFAVAVSLLMVVLTCAALAVNGVNLFGDVLASPQLYLAPLALVSLLPVYVLWAAPTIGWLMLVSGWARSKVFLWAVGTPLVALVIAKWVSLTLSQTTGSDMSGLMAFMQDVVARALTGIVPGIWFSYKGIDPSLMLNATHKGLDLGAVVAQSWGTLAGADAWIGVAAGAAMIFGAIRLRRWRDEG